MHYHYFTLEQRHALGTHHPPADGRAGHGHVLDRLRTPDFGVCESCGADIPYVKLIGNPGPQALPRLLPPKP